MAAQSRFPRLSVSREQAQAWIDRWDAQQQAYLPDREERFTALIDAVEEAAGRPDPLILDLGCGPGSLAVRLLDRLPQATVIAIDADPLLLALGRAASSPTRPRSASPKPTCVCLAGRRPWPGPPARCRGQHDRLALAGAGRCWPACTPKLPVCSGPAACAERGSPAEEDTAPCSRRLGRALIDREDLRRFPGGHPESWTDWWIAVEADPIRRRGRRTPSGKPAWWSPSITVRRRPG